MDIKIKITISTCERRREKEVMCVDLKFARINKKHNTRYNFLIFIIRMGGHTYELLCIFFIYPFWYMAYIFLKHTHHSLSLLSLKKYITLIYNIKIYIFLLLFSFLALFFFRLGLSTTFPTRTCDSSRNISCF